MEPFRLWASTAYAPLNHRGRRGSDNDALVNGAGHNGPAEAESRFGPSMCSRACEIKRAIAIGSESASVQAKRPKRPGSASGGASNARRGGASDDESQDSAPPGHAVFVSEQVHSSSTASGFRCCAAVTGRLLPEARAVGLGWSRRSGFRP